MKYRLPDGRQVQKKLGPAWTARPRPPTGYYTKRLAEEWLRDVLDKARRGTLPGTGSARARTFAEAAAEYLRYSSTTAAASRRRFTAIAPHLSAHLLPAFGALALEDRDDRGDRGLASRFHGSARTRGTSF